ncbi:MAG: proton-conducting transporter membrane subunit, partial [Cyanobacteria bacterium P01_F01_bin.42]
ITTDAPPEAIALLFLGLLTKGGIFVSGLWLPLTHSQSDTPVSAMLSGIVVKTGVFPLVRCMQLVDSIEPTLQLFGIGTAFIGVCYAIFESDTKRMLAWSTISQLGFVLIAPAIAGFYALTHGLAKASLFLLAGNLPSRKFQALRQTQIPVMTWAAVGLASLSISGFPLLAGFEAKTLVLKELYPWQASAMTVASVGTAIVFAKFLFLPTPLLASASGNPPSTIKDVPTGTLLALGVTLGGLVIANAVSYQVYSVDNIVKALITIGIGWLIYFGVSRIKIELPRVLEEFEHLIGAMSIILTAIFWMVQR